MRGQCRLAGRRGTGAAAGCAPDAPDPRGRAGTGNRTVLPTNGIHVKAQGAPKGAGSGTATVAVRVRVASHVRRRARSRTFHDHVKSCNRTEAQHTQARTGNNR